MGGGDVRSSWVWALVRRQHGVVARRQLLDLGYTTKAIEHRLRTGRLHAIWPGVYAVGRREVTQLGLWMAAVLAGGEGAALSHRSAAMLWGLIEGSAGQIHVSVPNSRRPCAPGIAFHRRADFLAVTTCQRIPVTTPKDTLIDIAPRTPRPDLELAVNRADGAGLLDTETLRTALDETPPRRGVGVLRNVLDRRTFRFTRSVLERRFLQLVHAAGLRLPETNVRVNNFEVDFYWPELDLVVETDGLAYHRTPAEQTADRRRDQTHTAAGLTTLRFTHAQIRYEPDYVRGTLARTARTLDDR